MLYRKEVSLQADLSDRRALEERLAQLDLVEAFVGRWFKTEDRRGFSAASHGFATATEFEEKLYDHLHALLQRRAGATAEGIEIRWHGPPFRGLAPFGPEHASLFFGRTQARNALKEILSRLNARGCAFLLVLGASGSGKSSLVRAGLLPDLRLPGMVGRVGLVREAAMKPSDRAADLVGALAAALLTPGALPELAELRYGASRLGDILGGAPAGVSLSIEQGLAAAAFGVAQLYTAGAGVPRDPLEAVRWLKRASDRGSGPAEWALGLAYECGEGVDRDLAMALRHSVRADNILRADNGIDDLDVTPRLGAVVRARSPEQAIMMELDALSSNHAAP